jgi:hypothetical protein
MSDANVLMGTFEVQELERLADALDKLRALGISDRAMSVISSTPVSTQIMGRPKIRPWLPWLSIGGGVLGFLIGSFLTIGTPSLYTVLVGGQPVIPPPPTFILMYECTMLGVIIFTFLGLLWLLVLPTLAPTHYDSALSDDSVGLFVEVSPEQEGPVREALAEGGAHDIQVSKRRPL